MLMMEKTIIPVVLGISSDIAEYDDEYVGTEDPALAELSYPTGATGVTGISDEEYDAGSAEKDGVSTGVTTGVTGVSAT